MKILPRRCDPVRSKNGALLIHKGFLLARGVQSETVVI